MMFNIAICDDEKFFCEYITNTTKKILESSSIPYNIEVFFNGKSLFNQLLKNDKKYDLFLLDILMDGMDGLNLAKKIRSMNHDSTLIFISSSPDFSIEGYEVNALHYLLKPPNELKLKKLLLEAYKARRDSNLITLKDGSRFVQLDLDKIMYCEIQGRKVVIYLENRSIVVSVKLSQLINIFPRDVFTRCHQSYIININYVSQLQLNQAIMDNEKIIPISRRYRANIKNIFLNRISKG